MKTRESATSAAQAHARVAGDKDQRFGGVIVETLETGDICGVPADQVIYDDLDFKKRNGEYAQFILVDIYDGAGQVIGAKPMYLSTLGKSRVLGHRDGDKIVIDRLPNGQSARAMVSGTVVETVQGCATNREVVAKLKERRFKVTDVKYAECVSFDRTRLDTVSFPQIDWV